MSEFKKYLILGAGPTGLGAAYRLKEAGATDFLILEKNSYAGGLATTFTDAKGFLWDIGGHVQFSHYAYFDKVMQTAIAPENWLHHEREAWVWIRNRFVPYPFQNNLRHLPQTELWQCLEGLLALQNQPETTPTDFEDWLTRTFGKGLCEVFMYPYNFKVWAYPPKMLSHKWIGERVVAQNLNRILENIILKKEDVSWGPNNTFQFPKHGGTGSIWNNVAELVGSNFISKNSTVAQINMAQKTVQLTDGREICYEHLLSTIPLDTLTSLCTGMAQKYIDRAAQLKYSTTHIVGIGLKGTPPAHLKTKCWMYFPEDNSPYYRVTVFSNYSPNNVPTDTPHWSLMAETSQSEHKPVDAQNLIATTLQAMHEDGLVSDVSAVVSTWQHTEPHGYPTPSVDRDAILEEVLPVLEAESIYSRGRFGGWKYEVSNQDHSFMQGAEWAGRVCAGEEEPTFYHPEIVNAPRKK